MMRAWVFLGLGAALSVLAGGAAARELNPLESLLIDTLQVFSVKSECTDTLIVDRKLTDAPCLKHVVSKGLGVAMVVGGAVVKFPQVYNLVRAGHSVGVSLTTQYLELFLYGTPVAYNLLQGNPFSTWGENVFLVFQVWIIMSLILHFNQRYLQLFLSVATYGAFFGAALTGRLPDWVLTTMQGLGIPLTVTSKCMTILAVVQGGETGALALITSFLNALGASARIFTTIQEVDDQMILAGWITAAGMNWVILLLFAVYPRSAEKSKKEQ
eukprot:m.452671 g.452671  ORF g.452671 m.452671 type:complete len:270 (-) comp20380_c0_seq1:101-910(-)